MKEIEIPEGYEARIKGNKVIIEPKESADERIRKELYAFISSVQHNHLCANNKREEWLAYLEKQKSVQSDTEKQYVRTLESLISDFLHGKQEVDRDYYQQICDWLEERHIEEKPVQWSEEDENRFNNLIILVEYSGEGQATKEGFIKFIKKLKSLHPQPHWKPNEYTLSLVKKVAGGEMLTGVEQMAMGTLHEQLKKL